MKIRQAKKILKKPELVYRNRHGKVSKTWLVAGKRFGLWYRRHC